MESSETELPQLKSEVVAQAAAFAQKLTDRLDALQTPRELAQWLMKYDVFNRGFPGAGLQLAGRIALQPDIFGDLGAEVVASRVQAAIADEFIDRSNGSTKLHSVTRRAFVMECLKALSGKSDEEVSKVLPAFDLPRMGVIQATTEGYGLNESDPLKGISSGLGFFTASETSGSTEFQVLGRYLSARWPGLLDALKGKADGQGAEVYDWVIAHQDLEADHAEFAFSAIEKAVENLQNRSRVADVISQVRGGFAAFFKMADESLLTWEETPVALRELLP